jgi:hypothetical protein
MNERRRLVKSKAISLKFVSESDEAVGYLMVETDDEKFAKQTPVNGARANWRHRSQEWSCIKGSRSKFRHFQWSAGLEIAVKGKLLILNEYLKRAAKTAGFGGVLNGL